MKKKNVIVVMLVLLAVMAIGYGAFSTTLTINGTANISSSWEVVFTEINQLSKTDGVTITTAPQASGTTATFDVDLTSPGDYIEYQIKVENKGSIDAKIESITATETGSDAIVFEISDIKEGQTLLKQATKTFKVKISYKDSITSQPNITTNKLTVSINFVQLVGSSTEGEAPTLVTEKLAARILKDNIAYADNVRSPYVNSDTGIDFSQVASAENGQGLYYTNTNTEGGRTTYYFRGNVDNNYVTIGEEVYETKGYCVPEGYEYAVPYLDYNMYENVSSQSECEAITDACIITELPRLTNADGCQEYVDDEGEEVANFAISVSMYWYTEEELVTSVPKFRIIRINEDGSVRLMSTTGIYQASVPNETRNYYKSTLQTWYDNNLSTYSNSLISNNFCYENKVISKVISKGKDDWTDEEYTLIEYIYEAYDRLVNKKMPKFGCSVAKDGGYVDLITADEVAYAGGFVGEYTDKGSITGYLTEYELLEKEDYYDASYVVGTLFKSTETTAEDGYYDIPLDYVGKVKENKFYTDAGTGEILFPVINVKGDVKVIKGNGTEYNPYVLQMN